MTDIQTLAMPAASELIIDGVRVARCEGLFIYAYPHKDGKTRYWVGGLKPDQGGGPHATSSDARDAIKAARTRRAIGGDFAK